MCKRGTHDLVWVKIPAGLSHTGESYMKQVKIDACIAPIVAALSGWGIDMRGSCCGHGKGTGTIDLQDGRTLEIHPAEANHPANREAHP